MKGITLPCARIACLLMLTHIASGHKILMSAILGEGSHFLCAASVGERLVKQGHNITFLISNAYAHRATDAKYSDLFAFEIFIHSIPVEEVHEQFNAFNARAFMPAWAQMWTITEVMRDGRAADCEALLGDTEIMDRLARSNFSALVYDIGWVCPLILAKRLQIPTIAISAVTSPCTVTASAGSVGSPAFVPEIFSGFSNRMGFRDRVLNSLAHVMLTLFGAYYHIPYDKIKDKLNIAPESSVGELYAQSELYLVNSDFSVEFPCALPPSVVPVGGLTTRPSNPLPEDIEQFMQSSGEDGIIVCTMGTYFTDVPIQVIRDFMNAFARLPQKTIFQLRNVPKGVTLPPNVLTLPWLPQNDLLGHKKTRAFLYQGGNNGFYEALYHATPIVVIPIHGDQYDTAAKVDTHGMGISIDKLKLTENVIYDALREVTTNVSYARTMQRLSDMFRDRPMTPAEKAAFWIDHVLKHGGDQYQMPYVNLNIIERNLIDVMGFLIGCLTVIVLLMLISCRLLIKAINHLTRFRPIPGKEKKE